MLGVQGLGSLRPHWEWGRTREPQGGALPGQGPAPAPLMHLQGGVCALRNAGRPTAGARPGQGRGRSPTGPGLCSSASGGLSGGESRSGWGPNEGGVFGDRAGRFPSRRLASSLVRALHAAVMLAEEGTSGLPGVGQGLPASSEALSAAREPVASGAVHFNPESPLSLSVLKTQAGGFS